MKLFSGFRIPSSLGLLQRSRLLIGLAVPMAMIAVSLPARGAEQTAAMDASFAPRWTFTVNVYAWLSGINGRVRTIPPLPAVDVNISFGTVLRNLDGALMGTAEARFDRYIFLTDLVASRISPKKAIALPAGPDSVRIESGAVIGSGLVGYRFLETTNVSLDVLVGARLFALNNTLSITGGPVSPSFGKSERWVDGVAGIRGIATLSDRLFMTVIAIGGGLSSRYEWDLFGGLGYRFSDRWSAIAGYRALKVDYRRGDFIYNVLQHGPVLGAQFRF